MQHAKNRRNKEVPLAILSRILAQSCITPAWIYVHVHVHVSREGLRLIVLISLVLLRGLSCSHDFSHGASFSFSWMNFALVPHTFCMLRVKCSYVHMYVSAAPWSRVSLVQVKNSSCTLQQVGLLFLFKILHWFCEKALRMGSLVNESWSPDLPVEL